MKKKLLKKSVLTFVATICLSLTLFSTHAQSLIMGTLPNPTVVGTSPVFNFTYTSTIPCALYAEIRRFDYIDGVLVQNYNDTYIAGGFSVSLPATATPTTGSATFLIPGSTAVSADLPADKRYAWIFKLTPGIGDYNQVPDTPFIYEQALIAASSQVIDNIAFTSQPPANVEAGTTQTLNISYTFAGERNLKVGITEYDQAGNYFANGPASYLTNIPATTATPVETTIEVVVPNDVTLSSELTTGHYYKWEFSYYTVDYSYLGGIFTTQQASIVPSTLGVSETNTKKVNLISNNPVGAVLQLNTNVDFNELAIYDLSGKKIMNAEKPNIHGAIDVSSLLKGIYILKTDQNHIAKFVKQ